MASVYYNCILLVYTYLLCVCVAVFYMLAIIRMLCVYENIHRYTFALTYTHSHLHTRILIPRFAADVRQEGRGIH